MFYRIVCAAAFILVGNIAHASDASSAASASHLNDPLVASKILTTALASNKASYPQYTDRTEGVWQLFEANTWTSGFFPATLYEMFFRSQLCPSSQSTNGTDWLDLARTWSTALIPLEDNNTQGHDVGFLSFPFSHELLVVPSNQTAQTAVLKFARDLAARFNPIVGCTRSWDTADPTDFTVIIDNMMNLEVLFAAADLNGNQTLRDIAMKHADTTIQHHFRPDGSTFHVVEYNSTTGDVIRRRTAQGYADNSTWTRGQSWAIYGYANMYNRTGETRYIETARRAANLFVSRLPVSNVPPWDFDAPSPAPADTSAAMIAASGMLFLSKLETTNATASALWQDAALRILAATTNLAWRPSWQSLLSNGTVNNPQGNNLTGIVYGDYYFVKIGNELITEGLATC